MRYCRFMSWMAGCHGYCKLLHVKNTTEELFISRDIVIYKKAKKLTNNCIDDYMYVALVYGSKWHNLKKS